MQLCAPLCQGTRAANNLLHTFNALCIFMLKCSALLCYIQFNRKIHLLYTIGYIDNGFKFIS